MSLDGIVVHALVRELQVLTGGRINKIHQPSNHDIVFQLRAQGANRKLLLSANPTYPRAHFTEQSFMNPFEAPMFCMLLRKHCENAVIESVEQVGMERIIRIRTRKLDELGDVSVKHLVMELMGRHSNLILMEPETGTILDGIHHVTPAISSHRIVLPGSAYVSPPDQGKAHPLETDGSRFLELMETEDAAPLDQRLVQRFSGLSPLVAKEIVHRSFASSGLASRPEHLKTAFLGMMEDIRQGRFTPNVVTDPKGRMSFSVVELTHLEGERQRTDTVSECLELYYGDKAERDTVKQRTQDLLRFLQNERNKNVKKLEKLAETLEEARNADRFRILGELVTGHLHLIRKGDKEVEAVDYYDENQATVKIALDPLLTPSDNAQRYYKKYTKMKNSLTAVQEQMEGARNEIRYLEALLQQLENAAMQDVEEIRDELVEQGYLRDRSKKARKKKKASDKPVLTSFLSSEGIPIYVGKNNTQNEFLTNRLAQASDTWLHTKDIPGSHVVIRSSTFGDPTLNEASQLAAYYSQAKASSQVPVDYTLIRHVRKPSGAKPGFVIYDHQKTLFVTPDEQLIKSLKPGPGKG